MPTIRVLIEPESHAIKTGLAVLGGTVSFVGLGRGTTKSKVEVSQPAVLRFHGAYLESARDPPVARAPFAEIRGELRRRADGIVAFTLPPNVEIQYDIPPPPDPPPTQLNLHYDASNFENIPASGSSALSLKLPSRPAGARHFELVAQLELQGSDEAATSVNAVLDVPLSPLAFFKARLVDRNVSPLIGQPFELELLDGSRVVGKTDPSGVVLVNPAIRGECILHLGV